MVLTPLIIVGSGILGFVVGGLTGLFGVGGGFLMTPALMIMFGIPGHIAVGTGLATILFTSSIALVKRRNTGTIDVKLALVIAIGSIAGVAVGSKLMQTLKTISVVPLFPREVDFVQFVLLTLFTCLLGAITFYLSWDYYRSKGIAPKIRIGLMASIKIWPYLKFSSLEQPILPILPLCLLGFLVGLLTALLGTGGGVLLLPILIYVVGQRTAKAVGTSILLVWISSLFGVMSKILSNEINIILLSTLVVGGLFGTHWGTLFGSKFTGPKLRLYFIYVILTALFLTITKLCKIIYDSFY